MSRAWGRERKILKNHQIHGCCYELIMWVGIPKYYCWKLPCLKLLPSRSKTSRFMGCHFPNQVEIHWVMASAPLGGSFSQAGSQTPPQTYRLRICIHSKIWERMLYRVFRSSLFFAFSQPEFPQLEYGNITKCIQRGKKKLKEDSSQEHRSAGDYGVTSRSSTLCSF